MFAHIAGMPVEETALSLGPVVLAGGGILSLKLREHAGERRARRRSRRAGRSGTRGGRA